MNNLFVEIVFKGDIVRTLTNAESVKELIESGFDVRIISKIK